MNQIINVKPLSVNESWQGKRFKTQKYKAYEKELLLRLPRNDDIKKVDKMSIAIDFYFSSKASDIDNPVKPLIDILQKKYGFNDSCIYEMTLKKHLVKKGEEKTMFTIKNLEGKNVAF